MAYAPHYHGKVNVTETPILGNNWKGIELSEPAYIQWYTTGMAVVDEHTKVLDDIRSGRADYLQVGDSLVGSKTIVRYIQFTKVTDNHVDEAIIVGELLLHIEDLRQLVASLTDKLKTLDQTAN